MSVPSVVHKLGESIRQHLRGEYVLTETISGYLNDFLYISQKNIPVDGIIDVKIDRKSPKASEITGLLVYFDASGEDHYITPLYAVFNNNENQLEYSIHADLKNISQTRYGKISHGKMIEHFRSQLEMGALTPSDFNLVLKGVID